MIASRTSTMTTWRATCLSTISACTHACAAMDADARSRCAPDYSRRLRGPTSRRSKRISSIGPGINRIQRGYEVVDSDGAIIERVRTSEDIREFTADELRARLTAHGFEVERTWWDYREMRADPNARFFTLLARLHADR